ncbi:MAG: cupin domain-containing protein [Actinomycetota bacterium]|nr:cupin domain-containing protein [Acidimicrobiia bacterium]MDQ3469528.1 cupin domain-containing protein [Actinomycetota bacterium]
MEIRRVVTGHDERGRAVFVDDRRVEPITVALAPGTEYHRLWEGDAPPSFPDDGAQGSPVAFFPPVGGYRFLIFSVPPGDRHSFRAPADMDAALAEIDEQLPGAREHMEPDAPGMHTTASIDFEVVLDGEVWLELDDGAEVHLRAGDTVVQNGTRHAWRNHGSAPARVVAFLVGAHHQHVPPA